MARALTMMDEQYGGACGRGALLRYLTDDVTPLCRAGFRSTADRSAMLSASAYLVQLAGWKAHDAGEQGLAQRYYLQAFRQASASGVPGHDAYLLRTMTHHAVDLRHPQYVLALADAALGRARAARVNPATEALFTITRAEALALAGQPLASRREIEHAHALLAQYQGEDLPFWATSWGPITPNLQSRTAKTYKALGDHDAAGAAFAASAAGRASSTWARIHSLELAWQAETQCAGGWIEQACATWHRSLDAMTGVRSTRTRKAVTGMRQALSPFRQRGSRAAAELYDRGGVLLRESA
jgi:hypothetical protein